MLNLIIKTYFKKNRNQRPKKLKGLYKINLIKQHQ